MTPSPIQQNGLSDFCNTPLHQLIDRISSKLRDRLPIQHQPIIYTDQSSNHQSRFQALNPPTITIQAYLTRLITLAPISVDAILLALLYINRTTTVPLIPSQSLINLRPRDSSLPTVAYHLDTVHRLILSGLILANKFISDHYLSASRASKVGGIPLDDLAGLERGLLKSLGFSLNFTLDELDLVARWVLSEDDETIELESDALSLRFSTQSISGSGTHTSQHDAPLSTSLPTTTPMPLSNLDRPPPQINLVKQTMSPPSEPDLISKSKPDLPLPSSAGEPTTSMTPTTPNHSGTTPTSQLSTIPLPIRQPVPNTSRRGKVFLRTNFICDPKYNSNYQSRRPRYVEEEGNELESQTRIVVTKLNAKVLEIKTEIIGYHLLTGEKVCKMLSNQSFELDHCHSHHHPLHLHHREPKPSV